MKKSLVLMGLLSLFLTACGGKEQTSSSQQSSSSGEEFSATLPILQEKEDTSSEKLDVLVNADPLSSTQILQRMRRKKPTRFMRPTMV